MVTEIAYGPVPSRRLGKSIGINHIPPKICSYACVYCQLGKAIKMESTPIEFYDWQMVVENIKKHVLKVEKRNEHIDYIAFVPDGEPTLDKNLGQIINGIADLPYKKAIITNASLLTNPDVRNTLYQFDWISFKVDAFSDDIWRKIDHPHKELDLKEIQKGILEFANHYKGKLVSETMLIEGVNTSNEELEKVAFFLSQFKPYISYIAIPTRTPANNDVSPANEHQINQAYQIFSEKLQKVEYLIGHEGHDFAHTGNAREDILSITAVHPMREDSLKHFLADESQNWSLIEELIDNGLLLETEFNGFKFYVRKLKDRNQF
jgi:wyosine [tRNA(Phe)-imidazoG37] synthetase (radical SAM superfamily)